MLLEDATAFRWKLKTFEHDNNIHSVVQDFSDHFFISILQLVLFILVSWMSCTLGYGIVFILTIVTVPVYICLWVFSFYNIFFFFWVSKHKRYWNNTWFTTQNTQYTAIFSTALESLMKVIMNSRTAPYGRNRSPISIFGIFLFIPVASFPFVLFCSNKSISW